jgi:tetratricopeptide (TPR) repeat protein
MPAEFPASPQSTQQISALVTASAKRSRTRAVILSILGVAAALLGVIAIVYITEAGKQVQQVSSANSSLTRTANADKTALKSQQKIQELLADGSEQSRTGQYDSATTSYDSALALDPKNVIALNGKGYLLFKQHNYPGAVTLLQQAVAKDPGYPWARYNLALALSANGDTDGAVAQLTTLLQQSPRFKATVKGDVQFRDLKKRPQVQQLLAP